MFADKAGVKDITAWVLAMRYQEILKPATDSVSQSKVSGGDWKVREVFSHPAEEVVHPGSKRLWMWLRESEAVG